MHIEGFYNPLPSRRRTLKGCTVHGTRNISIRQPKLRAIGRAGRAHGQLRYEIPNEKIRRGRLQCENPPISVCLCAKQRVRAWRGLELGYGVGARGPRRLRLDA